MTHTGMLYFLQADIKTMIEAIYGQIIFFLRKGATLDFR